MIRVAGDQILVSRYGYASQDTACTAGKGTKEMEWRRYEANKRRHQLVRSADCM
jgi:hypothetical protein